MGLTFLSGPICFFVDVFCTCFILSLRIGGWDVGQELNIKTDTH